MGRGLASEVVNHGRVFLPSRNAKGIRLAFIVSDLEECIVVGMKGGGTHCLFN